MTEVPASFPCAACLGCVSGAHPKLLVTESDGRFVAEEYAAKRMDRFLICEDLVYQLQTYCLRKLRQNPTRALPQLLEGVRKSLVQKEWGFSDEELDWMMGEVSKKLGGVDAALPGSGGRMASESYSKECFRQLVLAHIVMTDISTEGLAARCGITEHELDEVGAGSRDVELSVLEKVGAAFGLTYSRLPAIAERAQFHLPTTGPSPYTFNAVMQARSSERIEKMLLDLQPLER